MGQCPPVGLSLVVIVNPRPFSPFTSDTFTLCAVLGLLGLTGTSIPDIARSLGRTKTDNDINHLRGFIVSVRFPATQ